MLNLLYNRNVWAYEIPLIEMPFLMYRLLIFLLSLATAYISIKNVISSNRPATLGAMKQRRRVSIGYDHKNAPSPISPS